MSFFYKFEHNLKAMDSNVVGYAARAEARKNFHYLENIESIALTKEDVISYWEDMFKKKIKFDNVRVEPYSRGKVEDFYQSKDWGIFHGAYVKEPFGYSIFQAVDYGKIPIISKDWCKEYYYQYRANNKIEFDEVYNILIHTEHNVKNLVMKDFRDYLRKYDNIEEWVIKYLEIYNEDSE